MYLSLFAGVLTINGLFGKRIVFDYAYNNVFSYILLFG